MRYPKKLFTTIYGNEIWSRVKPKRLPIVPAGGGGPHFPLAEKSIRLARYGCANRPFYHINVAMTRRRQHDHPIEQLGTFDPMPNQFNEKLVSINVERLRYWLAHRTVVSKSMAHLLGLAGILPIHPNTYMIAWRNRRKALAKLEEQNQKEKSEKEEAVA